MEEFKFFKYLSCLNLVKLIYGSKRFSLFCAYSIIDPKNSEERPKGLNSGSEWLLNALVLKITTEHSV